MKFKGCIIEFFIICLKGIERRYSIEKKVFFLCGLIDLCELIYSGKITYTMKIIDILQIFIFYQSIPQKTSN